MRATGAQALALVEEAGFVMLAVSSAHAAAMGQLPAHPADPFDRMLAAQALTEPLRLLTHNAGRARCSDTVILV
jgi:PIN domain nuclease of toxin-antitoxin system